MKVSKPTWLSRVLGLLNWDIFTWKVYIGDAVENAIDWALQWVNWGIDQANIAYNKAVDAWNKALEVYRDLRALVYSEVQKAINLAATAKDWLNDRIDDAWQVINKVDTAWDNFRTQTLPKLLDTQWVIGFFGKKISSITDWWSPKKQEITDQIDTEVTPIRDELNKHSSWLDLIKDLFTDPEKWLLDRIESMLARFW